MKILCKLPNALTSINGIQFVPHKLGMISEDIEDDVAAAFLRIEGYVKVLPSKSDGDGSASSNSKSDRSDVEPEGKASGK